MASSDMARSPLEHVWRQFVPQGHDQALRNAFYNVAAAVFVGGAGAAAWSVYLILQPFVQALMWAVLCGSVLHPVKHKVAAVVRKWLHDVHETKSLLSLSVALLPVTCLDNLSEFIGWYVMNHVKGVIAVTVVLPLVYIVIHHTPSALSSFAYTILSSIYYMIKFFLDVIGYGNYLVILVVLIYFGLVIFALTPANQRLFRRLSLPVWVLASASVSCWWSAVSVPLFLVLSLLLLGGLGTEVADLTMKRENPSENVVNSVLEVCFGEGDVASGGGIESEKIEEVSTSKEEKEEGGGGKEDEKGSGGTEEKGEEKETLKVEPILEEESDPKPKDPSPLKIPRPSNLPPEGGPHLKEDHRKEKKEYRQGERAREEEESSSNMYLKTVFVACVLAELWRHSYLLSLLPLAMGYYCIKKATSYHLFGAGGMLKGKAIRLHEKAHSNLHTWYESRKKVLFTPPLVGVFKLLKRIDRRIVKGLGMSVDGVVTILIMLGCLLFVLTSSIFLAVQIQGEGMQIIVMGSQAINATIVNNPQFHELLPEDLNKVVVSALDNGYLYGREWIGNMLFYEDEEAKSCINATKIVRNVLGETNDERAKLLEQQVIELWDRIYQAWVVAHPQPPYKGPVVTSAAVAITFDSLVDGLMKSPGLISLSTLSDVLKDNLGTVMSVLEGVWSILIGNISLALSALTTASSLLLGGSLSLLNALLNLVVFLSSLFYILSISNEVYMPVDILCKLGPGQMNSLGTAVEDSINGVFKASFKMGAFYGMWTWLLHSLFDTNIVYIPSVLGALFGAVPLVGTYWAAVPGALELAWSHGSPFMGLLLIVAQLLPLSCVDTAFYAEIKGGGHPYLTGLAVAGGIFCWGVEGAILGPLLLCILLVVTKMYTSLIQSPAGGDFTFKMKKFRR